MCWNQAATRFGAGRGIFVLEIFRCFTLSAHPFKDLLALHRQLAVKHISDGLSGE